MTYRRLDTAKIIQTAERLEARIAERLPETGLCRVAAELALLSRDTADKAQRLEPPLWLLRAAIALVVLAGAALFLTIGTIIPLARLSQDAVGSVQSIEAVINTAVLAILGLAALIQLESRIKRRRAAAGLHELRAMIHVIDMHQLNKDPATFAADYVPTAHSPQHDLTAAQMERYLDYCSEMLAITGKLAALYAQAVADDGVAQAVNDIENLGSNLSRKVWQKITLLQGQERTRKPVSAKRKV
jgi:type II secretory pathway pseudopilin PulG